MDEGLSGISAGASVDIKRTDGEYLGHVARMWMPYAVRCSYCFA